MTSTICTNRSEHIVRYLVRLYQRLLAFPQPDLDGSQRAGLLHTLLMWLPRTLAIACFYANLHSHISLKSRGTENCPLSQPPPSQNRGYRVPGPGASMLYHLVARCNQTIVDNRIMAISSRSRHQFTYFTIVASIL